MSTGITPVEVLLRAYDTWLNTSASEVTEALLSQLDNLSGELDHGAIEPTLATPARHLVDAWDAVRSGIHPGDVASVIPHAVWRAIDALEDAHAAYVRSRVPELESIADLKQQGVPDRQICRIYGFVRKDGIEDLDMLAEEVAEPGRHTGKGWMAPIQRTRIQAAEHAVQAASERRQRREGLTAPKASATEADLASLVAEGVSGRQIARMLGISLDDVLQLCLQAKIEPPPADYRSVQSQRGAFEPEMLEAAERSMDAVIARPTHPEVIGRGGQGSNPASTSANDRPAPQHLLGDVVKMSADGMQPGQIARTLRKSGHAVTAAEVRELVGKS